MLLRSCHTSLNSLSLCFPFNTCAVYNNVRLINVLGILCIIEPSGHDRLQHMQEKVLKLPIHSECQRAVSCVNSLLRPYSVGRPVFQYVMFISGRKRTIWPKDKHTLEHSIVDFSNQIGRKRYCCNSNPRFYVVLRYIHVIVAIVTAHLFTRTCMGGVRHNLYLGLKKQLLKTKSVLG